VADVKADGSAFWGSTLGSAPSSSNLPKSAEIRLALPMPETSGEIFTNGLASATATPIKPEPASQSTTSTPMEVDTPASASDNVFVLREKGSKKSKKRKLQDTTAAADEDELKAGADQVGIDVDIDDGRGSHQRDREARSEQRRREKKEKKERKAREDAERSANGFMAALGAPPEIKDERPKEVKKEKGKSTAPPATSLLAALHGTSSSQGQTREIGEDDEEEDGEEAHFDYANAPSVLTAGGEVDKKRRKRQGKKGRMEGLDPYKKATDAPKGLPRGQRERIGKGGTFTK